MFENNNRNNNYSDAPVKKGEEYDVKIEDMGRSSEGIAKIEGYILFVPNIKKVMKLKLESLKSREILDLQN